MVSIPIIETVVSVVLYVLGIAGLVGLGLLMIVESFGIPPLPSEVILPFAGFLVATGHYSFLAAFLVALAGALVGSFLAYAVGRWGRGWLESQGRGRFRLDPKLLNRMDEYFAHRGQLTVIVARVIPVVRSYISYPAGTAKMDPVKFAVYTLAGGAPFTFGLLYLGYLLGSRWTAILPIFQIADYFVIAAIIVGAVYLFLRWQKRIGPGFPPKWTDASPSPPTEGISPPQEKNP
ncbi:MAG: DedA family protein [Thermoplasmata archaeon]